MNPPSRHALCPEALDKFIDVYGNRHRRIHFIAMRFKRAIITYKPNTLDTVPIEPPNNSIVFIRGKCPPINVTDQSFLLYTDDLHVQGIPVPNDSVDTLLRALFPSERVVYSHFRADVLYLVATHNPYARIMKPCRKDQAFRALCLLSDARQKKRALTLAEVAQLRFFKRYTNELKQFNKWSAFAFEICNEPCYNATFSHPSAYLGREVFQILNRSQGTPGPLPPPDFYQCEILYTDTEPVGIAFAVSKHRDQDLEYVSPMVVTRPKDKFRDTCSVICNAWLPFYKNRETWQAFGVGYYVLGLHHKKDRLRHILSWLQIQTSEKYRMIYMDLAQVAKILFGENARSFLRPI